MRTSRQAAAGEETGGGAVNTRTVVGLLEIGWRCIGRQIRIRQVVSLAETTSDGPVAFFTRRISKPDSRRKVRGIVGGLSDREQTGDAGRRAIYLIAGCHRDGDVLVAQSEIDGEIGQNTEIVVRVYGAIAGSLPDSWWRPHYALRVRPALGPSDTERACEYS